MWSLNLALSQCFVLLPFYCAHVECFDIITSCLLPITFHPQKEKSLPENTPTFQFIVSFRFFLYRVSLRWVWHDMKDNRKVLVCKIRIHLLKHLMCQHKQKCKSSKKTNIKEAVTMHADRMETPCLCGCIRGFNKYLNFPAFYYLHVASPSACLEAVFRPLYLSWIQDTFWHFSSMYKWWKMSRLYCST